MTNAWPVSKAAPAENTTAPVAQPAGNGSGSTAAAISATRAQWVDIARGIGIILVVYGHALRGNYGLPYGPAWALWQDRMIYAFHMPLFFVLAGLFLWKSLARSRARFLKLRWSQIIYPYLLWSLVTGLIELALAQMVNTPIDISEIRNIPFIPIEQYWFLYALLVIQLTAALVYPRQILFWGTAVLGLLAFAFLGGGWIVIRAFVYLPFVALGVAAVDRLVSVSSASMFLKMMLFAGGWTAFAGIMAFGDPFGDTILGGILAGMAGSIGTIALAMMVAVLPRTVWLGELGRASLAIYVAHTIFSAGMRITLGFAAIDSATLVSFVCSLAAGIVLPWLLWRWTIAQNHTRLFGFGDAPAGLGAIRAPAPQAANS